MSVQAGNSKRQEKQRQRATTGVALYEIRVAGHLAASWAEWFEGLTFAYDEDDNTILSGPVADQAALHGILDKIRDLGLVLLSARRLTAATEKTGAQRDKKEASRCGTTRS